MSSRDTFHEFLPSLLAKPVLVEVHGVNELGKKNGARYLNEIARSDELATQQRLATGSAVVMFASSDRDNASHAQELKENVEAADRIKRTLRQLGVDNEIEIIADYNRAHFDEALSDQNVGHLLFFGHSKRSGVYVPGDPILWRNTSPIDHVKKSVGIIGCGIYDRAGVTPRFGFNLVHPDVGVLYGSGNGVEVMPSQMHDLGNFNQLEPRLLQVAQRKAA